MGVDMCRTVWHSSQNLQKYRCFLGGPFVSVSSFGIRDMLHFTCTAVAKKTFTTYYGAGNESTFHWSDQIMLSGTWRSSKRTFGPKVLAILLWHSMDMQAVIDTCVHTLQTQLGHPKSCIIAANVLHTKHNSMLIVHKADMLTVIVHKQQDLFNLAGEY